MAKEILDEGLNEPDKGFIYKQLQIGGLLS